MEKAASAPIQPSWLTCASGTPDMTVVIHSSSIKAHKVVLQFHSGYFQDAPITRDQPVVVKDFPGSLEHWLTLQEYMYTGELKVDPSSVASLYLCAAFLLMSKPSVKPPGVAAVDAIASFTSRHVLTFATSTNATLSRLARYINTPYEELLVSQGAMQCRYNENTITSLLPSLCGTPLPARARRARSLSVFLFADSSPEQL